jgi:hypothetical protein
MANDKLQGEIEDMVCVMWQNIEILLQEGEHLNSPSLANTSLVSPLA